jgi:hypothetical protein
MTPDEEKRVAEQVKWAVQEERTRCARLAEEFKYPLSMAEFVGGMIAHLIRKGPEDGGS